MGLTVSWGQLIQIEKLLKVLLRKGGSIVPFLKKIGWKVEREEDKSSGVKFYRLNYKGSYLELLEGEEGVIFVNHTSPPLNFYRITQLTIPLLDKIFKDFKEIWEDSPWRGIRTLYHLLNDPAISLGIDTKTFKQVYLLCGLGGSKKKYKVNNYTEVAQAFTDFLSLLEEGGNSVIEEIKQYTQSIIPFVRSEKVIELGDNLYLIKDFQKTKRWSKGFLAEITSSSLLKEISDILANSKLVDINVPIMRRKVDFYSPIEDLLRKNNVKFISYKDKVEANRFGLLKYLLEKGYSYEGMDEKKKVILFKKEKEIMIPFSAQPIVVKSEKRKRYESVLDLLSEVQL